MGEQKQEQERVLVGYGPAAAYVGLKLFTFRAYVYRGRGPAIARREIEGHYIRPVFTVAGLDRWVRVREQRATGK